jgi:hypothetical protein
MAALALIKRAEALRAELHYGTVEEQYLISQTNLAKASYTQALEKCSTNPSLAAAAKFGLGLCAEELGDFDQARQMYSDITANLEFEGTVAVVQAKRRLETIADYEQKVVFKPAPKPVEPSKPVIQIKPADANLPADLNLVPQILDDILQAPDVNLAPPTNLKSQNGEPNSVSKVSDINVPGK